MKLEEMSDVEIKAAIFDQMVIVEQAQMNIRLANDELRKRVPLNGVSQTVGSAGGQN